MAGIQYECNIFCFDIIMKGILAEKPYIIPKCFTINWKENLKEYEFSSDLSTLAKT